MEATSWPGVLREGRDLYTLNSGPPGSKVYGETVRIEEGREYRKWDPFRSKLAALLLRGGPPELWPPHARTLYLGAAHGTTVSHVADLVRPAPVFAVEKSATAFAPLLALSERRENLLPILGDAQLPERYASEVAPVDWLYQDVAQRDQVGIFLENARATLRRGGVGILMLKVRSVTQRVPSATVVRDARSDLAAEGWRIRAEVALAPFSKEHVALVLRSA